MASDAKGRSDDFEANTVSEVAVVGGGIAGISAAIAAADLGVATVLVTDGALGRSNSIMAQGGIQIPADAGDDAALMLEDMVRVGGPELDRDRAVEFVSELPALSSRLHQWGLEFDLTPDGSLLRRSAGGLSSPRIVTAGDEIGRPLMRILRRMIADRCEIVANRPVAAVDIDAAGFVLRAESGTLQARSLVIATGGIAYQEAVDTSELTSNPPNTNGRLRQSLAALGLQEAGPRSFQWHPFGLPDSRRGVTVACVPESVAALGPRLVGDDGEEISELPAPRGAVVAAMRDWVGAGGREVRLTLSDLPGEEMVHFPKVTKQIAEYGADPVVTPVLHYELSGFTVAADQSTPVPGLFLAGEIVGGTHGRERLMGNGVSDSLVHGHRAGTMAARWVREG